MNSRIAVPAFLGILFLAAAFLAHHPLDAQQKKKPAASKQLIQRGEYLVTVGGCDDCHSPKIFTQEGPVPDTAKRLSGHPEGTRFPKFREVRLDRANGEP